MLTIVVHHRGTSIPCKETSNIVYGKSALTSLVFPFQPCINNSGMFIAPRPYMAGLGYPQLAVRFMPGVPHMPMARPILQHRIGYGPMGPMYNPTTYRTGYAPPPAPPIRRH